MDDPDDFGDPADVTKWTFEKTIERLEGDLRRANARIDALERDLRYKSDERHGHPEYAGEYHYH